MSARSSPGSEPALPSLPLASSSRSSIFSCLRSRVRRRPKRRSGCSIDYRDRLDATTATLFGGLALIVVATARFVRTGRLLDDPQAHAADSVRTELILSAVLVLLIAGFSAYVVLG